MLKTIGTYRYKNSMEKIIIEPSTVSDIAVLGGAALYLDANEKLGH